MLASYSSQDKIFMGEPKNIMDPVIYITILHEYIITLYDINKKETTKDIFRY